MILFSVFATEQVRSLLHHYHIEGRTEAAERLIEACSAAEFQVGSGIQGQPYPRPYPELVSFGYRWIKVHRYWFSYIVVDGRSWLTNVLHDAADLPSRVVAFEPPPVANDEAGVGSVRARGEPKPDREGDD